MKNTLPILLLIVSAGLLYFYILPRYDRVQALSLERDRYDDILSKSAELREIRRVLKDNLENVPPVALERLEKAIPSGLDVPQGGLDIPQLILDFNNLAVQRGIIIRNISTSNVMTDGRRGGESKPTQPYTVLAINFNIQVPYSNLITFLKDIETSLRIMDVVSLSVKTGEVEPLLQGYELTIHTYWFNK
jgi:Tfp pilus assembly protein PilO